MQTIGNSERDESPRWWTPRHEGEASAAYLVRVLAELGAHELADRARRFHFDDFLCPDEVDDGANILRLVSELNDWARSATRDQRLRARVVIAAAKDGAFDGTREEAAQWAESRDGQQTFGELAGGSENEVAQRRPQRRPKRPRSSVADWWTPRSAPPLRVGCPTPVRASSTALS